MNFWHLVSIDWSQLEFHDLCKISDHFILVSFWFIIDIAEIFPLSVESPRLERKQQQPPAEQHSQEELQGGWPVCLRYTGLSFSFRK